MKFNEFVNAMQSIEDDRNISIDIVREALEEALSKALKRQLDATEANIRVDINEEDGEIRIYQVFSVVEEVENMDAELSVEEAIDDKPDAVVGDEILLEHEISELGRPAALLAKNVLKQKIREAEKQAVFDEYIDQLFEMVTVSVETVEDMFLVVNLGRAFALMPKSAQIPGEHYYEGQKLKVVITELNKDSKGAQIIVSRSDDSFVRRLFEIEVPEIYQGIVEIKAIAREAGDRTKIAVFSKDPDVDPIGACIGPRGSRVQEVIEELRGEKIDIFEWTNDIDQLIKSALAPAEVLYVLPTEDERSVTVVVNDNQLSLAIGRRGKNARLAVKLTGKKIDIKPLSEIVESGIDYEAIALSNNPVILVEEQVDPRDLTETIEDQAVIEIDTVNEIVEDVTEEVIEVKTDIEATDPVVTEKEVAKKPAKKAVERKPREAKEVYVSKFEKLADPTAALAKLAEQEERAARRNQRNEDKKSDQDEVINDSDLEYEIVPEYTEEELAEIASLEESLDDSWIEEDIDFEDFEDYYDN